MFTLEQIEKAHDKVKSGADFPKYIQEIKKLGVTAFETWVHDSHTEYLGINEYRAKSKPQYNELIISETSDKVKFSICLKSHQQGKTDYYTFCKDCAETGIEKWVVSIDKLTCTYYDKSGKEIIKEQIPES